MAFASQPSEPAKPVKPAKPVEPVKPVKPVRPLRTILEAFRNEYAIYGVILVSALIAIAWEEEDDLTVLLFTLGATAIFWLAHVYAGTISLEDTERPRARALAAAAWQSVRHSAGMLTAMVLPAFFLLLAVIGLVDEYVAYYLALGIGVVILAVIGYTSSARRNSPWYWRLVSALVTASLGLLIIWLSALSH
jgi:hypothetical protein